MATSGSNRSFAISSFYCDRIRQLFLATLLLFLLGCGDNPKSNNYGTAKVSKLIRVYDGDTFIANIEDYPDLIGKEIRIRLKDYNAPEIKGVPDDEIQLGLEAKANLSKLLNSAQIIELRNIKRGKYFRIVADIYIDEKELKPLLKDYK